MPEHPTHLSFLRKSKTLPWKIYLTERTSGLVLHELSLLAADGGRIPYAAKSQLIEALLKDWLEDQRRYRAKLRADVESPTLE